MAKTLSRNLQEIVKPSVLETITINFDVTLQLNQVLQSDISRSLPGLIRFSIPILNSYAYSQFQMFIVSITIFFIMQVRCKLYEVIQHG